jgi:hypothetical protein
VVVPCARAGDASIINNEKNVMRLSKNSAEREEAHPSSLCRFGRDFYPRNRWGKVEEQKEWRQLLRDSMRDLNGRAFIADCKIGHNTPDQPPHDYYAFDPDNPDSVFARAYAVHKCLVDIRQKARDARRDLPQIEALPPANRGSPRQFGENQRRKNICLLRAWISESLTMIWLPAPAKPPLDLAFFTNSKGLLSIDCS